MGQEVDVSEDEVLRRMLSTPRKPHDSMNESTEAIELRPDGEERFRKAIHAAARSGPMHRPAKPKR
jgi:hypothetical protein